MGPHLARVGWVMPPMGLLYIASKLEAEGYDVDVYDAQVDRRSLKDICVVYDHWQSCVGTRRERGNCFDLHWWIHEYPFLTFGSGL